MIKTIIIIFLFNCFFNLYAEDIISKKVPNDEQKEKTLLKEEEKS